MTSELSLPAWLTDGGQYVPWQLEAALFIGGLYLAQSFTDSGIVMTILLAALFYGVVNTVVSSLAYFVYADS